MRVTAKVKEQTEAAILAAARRLFRRHGVDAASTRDIAKAAGVAAGTLFNYFPSKEAIAFALTAQAFEDGRRSARERIEPDAAGTLEQHLFTLIASDLRALADLRPLVADLLDAGLARAGELPAPAAAIRAARMEDVAWLLAMHGVPHGAEAPLLHLVWSVYLSVLAFWSRDPSPNQEDTLALLDSAVRMLTSGLRGSPRKDEQP